MQKTFFLLSFGCRTPWGFPEQKVVIFMLRKRTSIVCWLPSLDVLTWQGAFPAFLRTPGSPAATPASERSCLPRDARRPQQVPAAPPTPWQTPRKQGGLRSERCPPEAALLHVLLLDTSADHRATSALVDASCQTQDTFSSRVVWQQQ